MVLHQVLGQLLTAQAVSNLCSAVAQLGPEDRHEARGLIPLEIMALTRKIGGKHDENMWKTHENQRKTMETQGFKSLKPQEHGLKTRS